MVRDVSNIFLTEINRSKRVPLVVYSCSIYRTIVTVAAVWNIADIFNALMAFPNLIAILALSGVVVRETKDYFARQKKQSK